MALNSETELSPHLQSHFEEQGYCVHGEVAIHKRSTFIDHVAHTGPCTDPDEIVAIELKRGAGKSLRKQMFKLNRKHIADEYWGAVIAKPRSSTIAKWKEEEEANHWGWPCLWCTPGLLWWNGEEFETLAEPETDDKYHRNHDDRLLLVEENKGVTAGYSSGGDHDYLTQWSYLVKKIREWGQDKDDGFTSEDCYTLIEEDPEIQWAICSYSDPRRIVSTVLREMDVFEGRGKEGRYKKYGIKE